MTPFDPEEQDADLRDAVQAAYPDREPSPEGRARVASLAAKTDARGERPVRRPFWKPRRLGWALIFVASAAAAIQYLLHRPGEQAIRLMPADTLIAITLDMTPSPEQVPLFARLQEAIQREGLGGKLDLDLPQVASKSSMIKGLQPYLGQGHGVALLKTGRDLKSADSVQPVAFLSLTNARAVEQILAAQGQKTIQRGVTFYRFRLEWFKTTDMVAMLVADYLVVAPSPDLLFRVQDVYRGAVPAMADLTEYQAARAALPHDANLMLFVSPTALDWVEKEGVQVGVHAFADTRWMALSARLDDEGLRFDWRSPTEAVQNSALQRVAQIAPIAPNAYRELPAGAYSVLGVSQPGRYWNWLTSILLGEPDVQRAFAQDRTEAERVFNLSMERDILPGVEGHWWLGVYPDTSVSEKVGIVAVLDEANGADPVTLFAKSRASLEHTLSPANRRRLESWSPLRQTVPLVSKKWGLDEGFGAAKTSAEEEEETSDSESDAEEGSQHEADTSAEENQNSHPRPHITVNWDRDQESRGETPHFRSFPYHGVRVWQLETTADGKAQKQSSEAKEIGLFVAEVGRSLIAASSLPLLDKALAAWYGQGATLMDDPAFRTMRQKVTPGAQAAFMLDLRRILESLSSKLKEGLDDGSSEISANDVLGLFGEDDAGLVISTHYDGRLATGTFFLPLDYDRVLHLIGRASAQDVKSLQAHAEPPRGDNKADAPTDTEADKARNSATK